MRRMDELRSRNYRAAIPENPNLQAAKGDPRLRIAFDEGNDDYAFGASSAVLT
jgi:hypothetical protein